MRDSFYETLEQEALLTQGPVLVGFSGGVDSAVLLDLLAGSGSDLHIAHVNYGLRGSDSEDDENLVRQAARTYGLPLHVWRPSTDWRRQGRSLQDAARNVRYDFFRETCRQIAARTVAVAHNADDQVETVLLNLMRGAGVRGLRGMPMRRPIALGSDVQVARPLLPFSRKRIEAYARSRGLRWREDASNDEQHYRRNRVRHIIIPALRSRFGEDVPERLVAVVRKMGEHAAVESCVSRLIERQHAHASMDVELLSSLPRSLQGRVILDAMEAWLPAAPRSRANAERIRGLVEGQVGRQVTFGGGRVVRDRGELVFVRGDALEDAPQEAARLSIPGRVQWGPYVFEAERKEMRPSFSEVPPLEAFLSLDDTIGHLEVRAWKHGDRMQPLGMKGTKSIADILTDARVSHLARTGVPVVCSSRGIVWLVGHRIAEWARVGDDGRNWIRIVALAQT